jgi:hypothetical protein
MYTMINKDRGEMTKSIKIFDWTRLASTHVTAMKAVKRVNFTSDLHFELTILMLT